MWRVSLTRAMSQLREITAWALSSSSDEVALISDDITLRRYSSAPTMLMAVRRPPSAIIRNCPVKRWASLRCQWKPTPMVTSRSSNSAWLLSAGVSRISVSGEWRKVWMPCSEEPLSAV